MFEPAIFGALLEQALDEAERKRLGAHYTPRAYVERLVVATVIEPLRADWAQVLSTAERQKFEGRNADAVKSVRDFHDKLCSTRVLDPACGTGNFLYVSLELLKRLEGEVLEALADLGGQEALSSLEGHTVDPHQFLGMEINPRAVAIAELVLWIGYLQWHFRTQASMPAEPILRAFKNIEIKDAVLSATEELARDAYGKPLSRTRAGGEAEPIYVYKDPRQPKWPTAEFIVGNPPFIGKGEPLRTALGDDKLKALSAAHAKMNDSADFVMYWWDHAADLLCCKGTVLRRFGFVTTNSITQLFNRRVIERHLKAKNAISIVMAIPDHPWTKATRDSAAVRIAMTVAEARTCDGVLRETVKEAALDTDQPMIELTERIGRINADLTVGTDVTTASALTANLGIASMGPALGGRGFILDSAQAEYLSKPSGERARTWLKRLTTGRDITEKHRNRFVIDVRDFANETDLLHALPSVYQHLKSTVFIERQGNNDPKLRAQWWKFRRSNEIYFNAVKGLKRFIATVETAKHRTFVFCDSGEMLEHGVIGFGLCDAYFLGVLSSWILRLLDIGEWRHARRSAQVQQRHLLRSLSVSGHFGKSKGGYSEDRRNIGFP